MEKQRDSMAAHVRLRQATAGAHSQVDARFGGFTLSDPSDYRRFLEAHASAIWPIEAMIEQVEDLPAWRRRRDLIADDLARLGSGVPEFVQKPAPSSAHGHGMLYVLEGSRLGGGLLSRRVPEGMPARYLSAVHLPGEWRGFQIALDRRAEDAGEAWLGQAIEGAGQAFALFAQAAEARALRP